VDPLSVSCRLATAVPPPRLPGCRRRADSGDEARRRALAEPRVRGRPCTRPP
jgi:hypothetical protein